MRTEMLTCGPPRLAPSARTLTAHPSGGFHTAPEARSGAARRVQSGAIERHSAPDPYCAEDIAVAVHVDRQHRLPLPMNSDEHHSTGSAIHNAGLLVDPSWTRNVTVHPKDSIAFADCDVTA